MAGSVNGMDDRFIFRAKSLDHYGNKLKAGDWVYGAYTAYCMAGSPSEFEDEHGTYPAIYASEVHDTSRNGAKSTSRHSRWVRVDPRTVGQSTGQPDAAAKTIFEGDLLQDVDGGVCEVAWNKRICGWGFRYGNGKPIIAFEHLFMAGMLTETIIGNIHDSPEMLIRKEAQ